MEGLLIPLLAIICTIGLPILLVSLIVYKSVQQRINEGDQKKENQHTCICKHIFQFAFPDEECIIQPLFNYIL